ncbi:hypothetical protein STEG23_006873 [Scotinomys teguina]
MVTVKRLEGYHCPEFVPVWRMSIFGDTGNSTVSSDVLSLIKGEREKERREEKRREEKRREEKRREEKRKEKAPWWFLTCLLEQ